MKNILITGGAGFIGTHLSLELVRRGYCVRVLDVLTPQVHGPNPEMSSQLYLSIKDKVEFIRGSVMNMTDVQLAIRDQDAIVHLAAETGTGQSMYEISRYVDNNIGGTGVVLDVLGNGKHSIEKVIVASSRAIYGEGRYRCDQHGIVYPQGRSDQDLLASAFECKCPICRSTLTLMPTSEDSAIHPTSIYGLTKQTQEQMAMIFSRSRGIPCCAFRYQNVYGPGQSLSNPYTGVLSIFSTQIRNGHDIQLFEDGLESRDFVHVDDAVRATIAGLEAQAIESQPFNVGSGIATSIRSVAEQLTKSFQAKVHIKTTGGYRKGDIRHNYADLSNIRSVLGYEPLVPFAEGITRFTQWVLTQEIAIDRLGQSLNELKSKGLLK